MTTHTAQIFMNAVQQNFGNRFISDKKLMILAGRLDHQTHQNVIFFKKRGGYLKIEIYAQLSRYVKILQKEKFDDTLLEWIRRVEKNIRCGIEEYSISDGRHIEEIMFKNEIARYILACIIIGLLIFIYFII